MRLEFIADHTTHPQVQSHGRKMTSGTLHADTSVAYPTIRDTWFVVLPLTLYAILWVLGISNFIWVFVALPLTLRLLLTPTTEIPPGFGIWLVFLGWVALSFTQIGHTTALLISGHRASTYLTAAILLVYTYNLPATHRHARAVVAGVSAYWMTLVLLGTLALMIPVVSFPSALELILPTGIAHVEYVQSLIHPRMAQMQDFLGYISPRPSAPFEYTNQWGAGVGMFAPVYLYWASALTRTKRLAAMSVAVIALLPIILSLNRGLWVSLVAAALYTSVRHALQGRVRPLFAVLWTGAFVALILMLTPLSSLVRERSEHGHSDKARAILYESAIDATLDAPLTGHGIGVRIEGREDRAPAGSHGEIWSLLVQRGLPATITYLVFIGFALLATWKHPVNSIGFWTHVVLVVSLVQMFVYSLTASLPIMFALLGLSFRIGNTDNPDGGVPGLAPQAISP